MIKAHEIQGVAFARWKTVSTRVGLESCAAPLRHRLDRRGDAICSAGNREPDHQCGFPMPGWMAGPLRTISPRGRTPVSRKSWAAGDAHQSRRANMALMALKGEMGYPSALLSEDVGLFAMVLFSRTAP